MNEAILYALAGAAVTIAGFSGVVVVLPLRGSPVWSPTEIRMLRLLITDSLVVFFLALLPVPLWLANWPSGTIWGFCSALLGSWLVLGDYLAIRGEQRDRTANPSNTNPINAPIRYGIYLVAFVTGVVLWLSVWDLVVPGGQALYVLGLMFLLAIAAIEFVFFIGLMMLQNREQ
ncbi:MAG: hypothetical protein SVX38_13195 [Chloroflexota bacterium]|nr:hypothetical protein [Chloroflexota bacterium]